MGRGYKRRPRPIIRPVIRSDTAPTRTAYIDQCRLATGDHSRTTPSSTMNRGPPARNTFLRCQMPTARAGLLRLGLHGPENATEGSCPFATFSAVFAFVAFVPVTFFAF
jgi:hypothetical protein